jgi:hypothetical protein
MMFFLGSVGPDDFSKNYAAWAKRFGLADWADWLSIYATGPRVFWVAAIISIIYFIIAFGIPFIIKRASSNISAILVPIIVVAILCIAVLGQSKFDLLGERHVSEYQRSKLKEILQPISHNFARALTVAAIDTSEAQGYASEIMI